MIYRCILAKWAGTKDSRRVYEGQFTSERLAELNAQHYNIYYLPNTPSVYQKGRTVEGSHIDRFKYVFVDFDLKSESYPSKDAFIEEIAESGLTPTRIVDSGNGIHVYWEVTDLDAMSYLRLQKRLIKRFHTDPAVAQIYQLLRVPGTFNTKDPENPKLCEELYQGEAVYTCEKIAASLPPISMEEEEYCKQHFDKTYNIEKKHIKVDDVLPRVFIDLISKNTEVRDIWQGNVEDRSAADFRLGHVMFAHKFTKAQAMSVLVNCPKAIGRAPIHRVSYAESIVDKIWAHEIEGAPAPEALSFTVRQILDKGEGNLKGTRFPCARVLDATEHGFRLGQVIGLVAGSGVGKTAMALNMFRWFVQNNPNCDHFFVPLEQPSQEIADRWRTMCTGEEHLFDKVHIMSNYASDGTYRRLSLKEIEDYIVEFQKTSGRKIGCVVIDHIGVLKKAGKPGEKEDIGAICQDMKAFAQRTDTMLVMQSQTSREKAGIGDLELNKDAAYGTSDFENYCDYLITMWQPLKRCYTQEGCPTVTAFKFCKIRHKKKGMDEIQEDVPYRLLFNPTTEHMRPLTQDEEKSFDFFNKAATNLRKKDRKTDILEYTSTTWVTEEAEDGNAQDHKDSA